MIGDKKYFFSKNPRKFKKNDRNSKISPKIQKNDRKWYSLNKTIYIFIFIFFIVLKKNCFFCKSFINIVRFWFFTFLLYIDNLFIEILKLLSRTNGFILNGLKPNGLYEFIEDGLKLSGLFLTS